MSEDWDDRLSRIETLWTVVRRAHAAPDDGGAQPDAAARAALERLLERYGGAVRRYALAALRSQEGADDVFQEFALRFVRGDFARATPERGRFRSFLKTTVYHLIVDHQRRRKRAARDGAPLEAVADPAAPAEAPDDGLFDASWRDDLLSRVWGLLEQDQQRTGGHYYTALRCRVDAQDARSDELAAALSERIGKPFTAGAARVLLHRARERFAALLLEEVAQSLDAPDADRLQQELIDLNLLEYCRPALEKRGDP